MDLKTYKGYCQAWFVAKVFYDFSNFKIISQDAFKKDDLKLLDLKSNQMIVIKDENDKANKVLDFFNAFHSGLSKSEEFDIDAEALYAYVKEEFHLSDLNHFLNDNIPFFNALTVCKRIIDKRQIDPVYMALEDDLKNVPIAFDKLNNQISEIIIGYNRILKKRKQRKDKKLWVLEQK